MKPAATAVLVIAIAAMCALAYVWPFAVSADRSDPVFKVAALTAFLLFFASLIVLLAHRVLERAKR